MKLLARAAQLLFALTAAAAFNSASASVIALDSTPLTGNQQWTGSLGMDFDVLSPILVTSLGAFDSGHDGFANTIRVGIFNRDTGALVGSSAGLTNANTTYAGTNNRMADIVDFVLGTGRYAIVAQGFGAQDRNGNAGVSTGSGAAPTINTDGGAISFTGRARFGSGAFAFPSGIDGARPTATTLAPSASLPYRSQVRWPSLAWACWPSAHCAGATTNSTGASPWWHDDSFATRETMMIHGMRTTIYPVTDLAQAKSWFTEVFGKAPYFDQPFYVGFEIGGFELGLVPDGQAGTSGATVYWGVDDIEAEVERIVGLGATVHTAIQDVGESIRVADLKDPFGNLLGLIYNPHFDLKAVR